MCVSLCVRACTHVCEFTSQSVCMCVSLCVRVHTCVCVCVCVCVCLCERVCDPAPISRAAQPWRRDSTDLETRSLLTICFSDCRTGLRRKWPFMKHQYSDNGGSAGGGSCRDEEPGGGGGERLRPLTTTEILLAHIVPTAILQTGVKVYISCGRCPVGLPWISVPGSALWICPHVHSADEGTVHLGS